MNHKTAVLINRSAAMLSPNPTETKALAAKLKRDWYSATDAERALIRRGMKLTLAEKAQPSSESA